MSFTWGQLRDHLQPCGECEGTGDGDLDDPHPNDPCPYCDGGEIRWGSYYTQDTAECDDCGADPIGVAAMFAPGCIEYVCIDCYLTAHRRECGCSRWAAADRWQAARVIHGLTAVTGALL